MDALEPTTATASTSATPGADSPGLTLFVITIVSLLANRLARPEVIPIVIAGRTGGSQLKYARVFRSACA